MKVRVRMRGPEAGGAKEGTPKSTSAIPTASSVQLQDPRYCGGAGALGDVCGAGTSPKKGSSREGPQSLHDVRDRCAALERVLQGLFGLGIRSYQGPTAPTLGRRSDRGVPDVHRRWRWRTAGAPPAPPRPASINHVCLSWRTSTPTRLLKTLESFGIKPRERQTGPVGPMRHYISMRMENRGGAKEGTPELYFTDPDGILMQLQDVRTAVAADISATRAPRSVFPFGCSRPDLRDGLAAPERPRLR